MTLRSAIVLSVFVLSGGYVIALENIFLAPGQQTPTINTVLQACSLDLAVAVATEGTTGSAFDDAVTGALQPSGLSVTPNQDQSGALAAANDVDYDGLDTCILVDAAIMAYLQDNVVGL